MGTVVGLGHKSFLQLAKETIYGTAPSAATNRYELVTASVNGNLSTITDPSMNNVAQSPRFIGQGGQYATASFRVRVNYSKSQHLWKMLLPTYTFAVSEASVSGDHTFKEALSLDSWTIEISWGDVPSGKVTRLVGCFLTSFRIAGTAGTGDNAMLLADIDVVAKSATANTTPMTPATVDTARGIIYHHLLLTSGNLGDGSGNTLADIRIRDFEFSWEVPHDTTRFYFGSVNAESPVRSGYANVRIAMTQEWNDHTLMANALAGTPTTPIKLFFRGGALGANFYELQITGSSPTAVEYSKEIPGFTATTQRVAYVFQYNTTDASAMVVRVRDNNFATMASGF
jgi:hypothetical protein